MGFVVYFVAKTPDLTTNHAVYDIIFCFTPHILMRRTLILTVCTMTGLLCITHAWAQEAEEEKKKPSWSTGLPERASVPTMNTPASEIDKPSFEVEQPTSIEIPAADLALPDGLQQKFELPEMTIDNSTPEVIESDVEPDVEPDVEYGDFAATDSAQLNNYSWEILDMEPVKIPKSLSFSNQQVMLEISINPKGEVVKVRRVNDRTSNKILNYASSTIKKWRFSAPEAVGINGIISKTMTVALEPR